MSNWFNAHCALWFTNHYLIHTAVSFIITPPATKAHTETERNCNAWPQRRPIHIYFFCRYLFSSVASQLRVRISIWIITFNFSFFSSFFSRSIVSPTTAKRICRMLCVCLSNKRWFNLTNRREIQLPSRRQWATGDRLKHKAPCKLQLKICEIIKATIWCNSHERLNRNRKKT